MIIIGLFITLTILEAAYVWWQWDKISIVVDVVDVTREVLPEEHKVNKIIMSTGKFIGKFKKLLWVPAGIILFLNLIISLIVGGVATLIISLF